MESGNNKGLLAGFVLFITAIGFIAFVAGILAAIFQIYPYAPIQGAVSQLAAELQQDSSQGNQHFLYKARSDQSGITIHDALETQPGVTLLTSFWRDIEGSADSWRPALRLINAAGELLHEWPVKPEQIWPQTPYTDWAAGTHNNPTNYVHGAWLLPDGDVLFNVEYMGMVRMNACGEVLWKTDTERLHHSVARDDDGNFWASGLRWAEQPVAAYPHLNPPFVDEHMVQVSPQGEILRTVSILDALYQSGFQGTMQMSFKKFDVTHMNDVELLSADMAAAFPMFTAGDILVSLRNLNLVVVVDGRTELIKWHFSHPLIRQHDPDFEADGTIVIFDNNDDTTREGSLWGRTRLLKVSPATNDYEIVYPTRTEQSFYSQEGGKHQLLENGNRLITEANAGRVFEVTPAGETVWEWISAARDGDYLPEVLEGTRYPESAAEFVETLSCN